MGAIPISVLDQSPVLPEHTPAQAVAETIALAKCCEALGYTRYWVAEHHDTPAFAGSAPEVLLAALASHTSTIRLGSGGVMLPYYSPYKVAEQFRMLEALAPARMDLGLGRAPGGSPKVQAAMRAGPEAWPLDVFPQQIVLLRQFLEDARGLSGAAGGFEDQHPYAGIHAQPIGVGQADIWILGSAHDGAVLAGQLGLPYCFAHFINADGVARAVELYHAQFRPSAHCKKPRLGLAISALLADDDDTAKAATAMRDYWAVQLLQNKAGPFPAQDILKNWQPDGVEKDILAAVQARHFCGTADAIWPQLQALRARYEADELFVVTIADSYAARRTSYERLAQAAGLQ